MDSAKTPAQRRVLVVDDDREILKLLNEALLKDGYLIETCANGEEALDKIKVWRPDLILMDQDMPGLSGLETLKELRAQDNYTSLIFVSAHSTPTIVVQSLQSGADDYVTKPFNFSELRARVQVRLRIKDLQDKLQEMTERDDLTGLYNMRSMYDRIAHELARAKRFKRQVAAVMMDMDRFKSVNDSHDHLFGSFVLQEVGGILKRNLREIDFAARYGGDEFLVILTETDENGAAVVTERLRREIQNYHFVKEQDEIRLTSSIGYALSDPAGDITPQDLVKRADKALYDSKNAGRNRCTQWSG